MMTARRLRITFLGLGLAITHARLFCLGQNSADAIPSLGDFARHVKAEQAGRPSRLFGFIPTMTWSVFLPWG